MTSSYDRQAGNGRRPFFFSTFRLFIDVLFNWSGALSSMSEKMSNNNIELITHVNLVQLSRFYPPISSVIFYLFFFSLSLPIFDDAFN